ncbi:MAG TPA: alanine:cation symporter family protein [Candidatus Bathyarchaeia archaeon]|nr:alanine:cation symporter family protein [Candidatus Bathyarchaeia archaeon]
MDILLFFQQLNALLALPSTCLFFGVSLFLTLYLSFPQIRLFPRLIAMLRQGFARKRQQDTAGHESTISAFHALLTAMGTAIGTGSIVAPSLAIIAGGPGALFWLIIYLILGASLRFVEVTLALATRQKLPDGRLVGGPMQYLHLIHPFLSGWYGVLMLGLFFGWQTVQSNTLATIFAQEAVAPWIVGFCLAGIVSAILAGGAHRVGLVASKLVPFMFFCYVSFSLFILYNNSALIKDALSLVLSSAFSSRALAAGGVGVTLLSSMRAGIYRGIFISEAGLGTAGIPQAIADTSKPSDQGTLALYSIIADIILSLLSGLLVLVSGVWQYGNFRSTMIYEVFKQQVPGIGQWILLASISLFVLTTVIGNSFNGLQLFTTFTKDRYRNCYIASIAAIIFCGSLISVPLAWEIMDTLLACAAIPHVIGLVLLTIMRKNLFF